MQSVIEKDDLTAIFNFVELVLKVTLKWYEILPLLVPAFKEAQQNPELIFVDIQAALAMCGYEMNQILGKLFGLCKRAKTLFAKFNKETLFQASWCKDDLAQNNGFQCSLINKFCEMGGLDRIIHFVQRHDMPLSLLTSLLN